MKTFIKTLLLISIVIVSTHLFASTQQRSAIFPGIDASDGTFEGAIYLQWPSVPGTDTYQVYRSKTPAALGDMIYQSNSSVSYVDYEVDIGITYYYQLLVCSVSMCIYYEAYDDGYASPVTKPAPPPTNLQASDGTYLTSVKVTWDMEADAWYYKLYRSSSPDQVGGLVYQSKYRTQTDFIDTTVTPGVTHYYRIQSCISNSCSGYSVVESGYADEAPAPPPSFLSASDGDYEDKVYLEWEYVSGAKYYKLYRSSSADQVGGLILQTANNTKVSYFDLTVTPGVTHYYRIQSCISNSCSGYGSVESGYASAASSTSVAATIAGKTWTVSGYFIQYASGAFDWIYVTPNGKLAAKLEGMDQSSGELNWKIAQSYGAGAFDSIETFTIKLDDVVSTSVSFGDYIINDATLNILGTLLERQVVGIDGYFIRYGGDAYDWLYVTKDKGLVAKLDGMNPDTKYFIWTILKYGSDSPFTSVSISNDGLKVTFGALK